MGTRVAGKVAIVTGAGAGMGRESARLLAAEGAQVVIAEWDEQAAVATRAMIEAEGGIAAEIVLDVSIPENAERMVEFAVERFGALHVMHNQVFAIEAGLIEDITPAGWNTVLQHTVTATFLGMKYGLPAIRSSGGGSIVNTASLNGLMADPGLAAYGTAKAGVVQLTKFAAIEYGKYGIRVNSVSPGPVATNAFLQVFGEATTSSLLSAAPTANPPREKSPEELAELKKELGEGTQLGRLIRPEEIAQIVLFLAGDESMAITGENVVADAGVSARQRLASILEV